VQKQQDPQGLLLKPHFCPPANVFIDPFQHCQAGKLLPRDPQFAGGFISNGDDYRHEFRIVVVGGDKRMVSSGCWASLALASR